MTTDPTPDTMRRLAVVRLLFSRAEKEAALAPPFSVDSVNRLHDVTEMFLALAAQVHHVNIPRELDGYWEVLKGPLGRSLLYRAQMQKFNKVRVNLKHYGVQPHASEIVTGLAAVRGLLEDECPALFGVALAEVSLSRFVTDETARALLDKAEERWDEGKQTEAFADLSDAFDSVIGDYTRRKLMGFGRSVFDSTADMTFMSAFFRRVEDRDQAKFDDMLVESLKALDLRVRLVGLGVDLRRYGKFFGLIPNVIRLHGGGRHVSERNQVVQRDQSDYEFCRDFVLSTAIHLAEFDYDLGRAVPN